MANPILNNRLTPRQELIRDLIAAGKCNKEIARELKISPRTVEDHRQALFKKLEVRTSAALIYKIMSARIAELEAMHGAN